MLNTNGNYYVNRLRRRESFKRLINIGLSAICLFLEIALFAYMWQFHFQFQLVDPLQKIWYRGFLLENGIYSVILIFFSVTYGGMRLGYMKNTVWIKLTFQDAWKIQELPSHLWFHGAATEFTLPVLWEFHIALMRLPRLCAGSALYLL